MVSAGLTAADDGNTELSVIQRLLRSWLRPVGSTTLSPASTPMRAVPHWCEVATIPRLWVKTNGNPARRRARRVLATSSAWAFEPGRFPAQVDAPAGVDRHPILRQRQILTLGEQIDRTPADRREEAEGGPGAGGLDRLAVELAEGLDIAERIAVVGAGPIPVVQAEGLLEGDVQIAAGARPDDEGGRVAHVVAADHPGAVRDAVRLRPEQEGGTVDGARGEDIAVGLHLEGDAVALDLQSRHGVAAGIGDDPPHCGVGHQLDVVGVECRPHRADVGIALGVDEAGVGIASPAEHTTTPGPPVDRLREHVRAQALAGEAAWPPWRSPGRGGAGETERAPSAEARSGRRRPRVPNRASRPGCSTARAPRRRSARRARSRRAARPPRSRPRGSAASSPRRACSSRRHSDSSRAGIPCPRRRSSRPSSCSGLGGGPPSGTNSRAPEGGNPPAR